jgi:hypothetical protein
VPLLERGENWGSVLNVKSAASKLYLHIKLDAGNEAKFVSDVRIWRGMSRPVYNEDANRNECQVLM